MGLNFDKNIIMEKLNMNRNISSTNVHKLKNSEINNLLHKKNLNTEEKELVKTYFKKGKNNIPKKEKIKVRIKIKVVEKKVKKIMKIQIVKKKLKNERKIKIMILKIQQKLKQLLIVQKNHSKNFFVV